MLVASTVSPHLAPSAAQCYPHARIRRTNAWPPERPTSTSRPCARAAPTSGTNSPTTCCPPGSPTWISASRPPITAALQRLTDNQEYGYAAREGALAAAFARRMQRRFGWQADPADAHPIGDLVQASFSSVMAFSEPGDAVLLQLPSYPPFMAAINDTGRRLIANPMRDNGTRWVLDLAAYDAAPDPRARVLIFCHPQNPTGPRLYPRGTGSGGGVRHPSRPDRGVGRDPRRHRLSRQHAHPAGVAVTRRSPRAPSPSPRRPRASTFPRCAAR